MKKILRTIFILVYLLFLVNETFFLLNKKEIKANVEEIKKVKGSYDEIKISFNYKKKQKTASIKIKNSLYDLLKNKKEIVIYYDDFLIKDIYFKDQHPYFIIRLFLMYLIFLIIIFPKASYKYIKIIDDWIRK